jgi:hypothetical protein
MRKLLNRLLRPAGYELVKREPPPPAATVWPPDLADSERLLLESVQPFTMTSPERQIALLNAVRHLTQHRIAGDIVECGVWRGGSMMIVARMLLTAGDISRDLWLYDTFEGMSPPSTADLSFDGQTAAAQLDREAKGTGIWCHASIEDVRANLQSTGYPMERIHLVQGKVEDTIPRSLPGLIALLRLDTDWYESTRHELIHLYPLLQPRGVLIIDDYGHWQGARQAVDEYFANQNDSVYLHRIDYTGRILVKS